MQASNALYDEPDPTLAVSSNPDAEKAKFLAEAWHVAYAKAKALGWLR